MESEVPVSTRVEKLSGAKVSLIKISACLAAGKYRSLEKLFKNAIRQKIAAARVYEVLLQSYLFLGYPKALEGIKLFRATIGRDTDLTRIDYEFRDWADWKNRGQSLCRKVYGNNFNKLVQKIGAISPELSEWMIVEGYGKVLSRGVLSGAMRELCTVAALTVTSDINQLHSHMRGARNLGASQEDIRETVIVATEFCSKQKSALALELFDKIFRE